MSMPRVFIAIAGASALVGAAQLPAQELGGRPEPADQPTSSPVAQPRSAPVSQAALRIYVDPTTGKVIAPPRAPAAPAPSAKPSPSLDTSGQGLVRTPAPGGGVMINLQGRFRNQAVATMSADGRVDQKCQAAPPSPPRRPSSDPAGAVTR